MSTGFVAARSRGLLHCGCCGLVLQPAAGAGAPRCPRCDTELHALTPRSVQRTTAFLLTAVALYVPANLLPVMSTNTFLGTESHTLVGGILELWHSGSWELALIVFIASIAVPLLKVAALGLLAWTAHRRSTWRQRDRAALYRLVETVGHWSMSSSSCCSSAWCASASSPTSRPKPGCWPSAASSSRRCSPPPPSTRA